MKSEFIQFYSSPLGPLEIQSNGQQITAINFEEDQDRVENTCALTTDAIQQLDEYFNGKRIIFDFPLGQPGTSFQRNVWDQLIKIPFGKTISYLQLSKQIGDVKAIRAIAAANGRNRLAIVVPCHRVIGSDATLVGYAGGLWRKKWLLEHEAKIYSGTQQLALQW